MTRQYLVVFIALAVVLLAMSLCMWREQREIDQIAEVTSHGAR